MRPLLLSSLLLPVLLSLAQGSQTPKLVELPLLDCSGLPCIDMTAGNGKNLRLLLDTGEVNAFLDSKAAETLGLALQPLKGANESISQVQQTVVPGAKLGSLPMGDFPFMVLDTTPQPDKPGETPQALPADGALTFGSFKNRLLQIDYAHRVVRISEPQTAAAPCPAACSDLVIKHFGNFGPVTLTAMGFAVNGRPVEAQIDTLFTGTMLVYPAAIEKLDLKKAAKSKHKESFPYTQGGVKLARFDGAAERFHDMPLLQNGPLYFFTADGHPPAVQFDVTVGSGLLRQGVVTFDFKGMKIWIESESGAPAQTAPQAPK